MLEKVRDFVKTFIFVELGAGTARSIMEYFEYRKYGHLTSAPWYVGVVGTMLVTAVVIAVSFLIWLILGYMIKRQNEKPDESEGEKSGTVRDETQSTTQKPRYRHKFWYWAVAGVWLGIAAGWAKIALSMQRVHWPFLSWFFVLCYIGLAIWEIYRYFEDKNKFEK